MGQDNPPPEVGQKPSDLTPPSGLTAALSSIGISVIANATIIGIPGLKGNIKLFLFESQKPPSTLLCDVGVFSFSFFSFVALCSVGVFYSPGFCTGSLLNVVSLTSLAPDEIVVKSDILLVKGSRGISYMSSFSLHN